MSRIGDGQLSLDANNYNIDMNGGNMNLSWNTLREPQHIEQEQPLFYLYLETDQKEEFGFHSVEVLSFTM